jgi:regulatory protein YycH of two-component signal transduction system YycFG
MIRAEELEKDVEFIGKKREIIDLSTLMATFIRDTKAQNIKIADIYLCYFYNSDKIGESVKYAEAEPSWVIEVDGEKYIYSAYTGNYSKTI